MQIYLAKDVKVAFKLPPFNGRLNKKQNESIEPTYGRSAKVIATLTPLDLEHQNQITGLAKQIGMIGCSKTGKSLADVPAGGSFRWRVGIDMGIHASVSELGDNGFPKSAVKGFIRVRDDFPQGILESLCDAYQQHEETVKLSVQFTRIQCIPEGDCVTVLPQLSFTGEDVVRISPIHWYGVEKTGLDVADGITQDYWKLGDRICGWNACVTIVATVPDY